MFIEQLDMWCIWHHALGPPPAFLCAAVYAKTYNLMAKRK